MAHASGPAPTPDCHFLAPQDLECPICMSLLSDPFVTACGHTFCYGCIATHLQSGNTCPSCSSYLTKELTYPNFVLSKVTKRAGASGQHGGGMPACEALHRAFEQAKPGLTPADVDGLVAVLLEHKRHYQQAQREGNMQLLLHFLQHSRQDKARKLEALRKELSCLDVDITRVETTCVPPEDHQAEGRPARPAKADEQPQQCWREEHDAQAPSKGALARATQSAAAAHAQRLAQASSAFNTPLPDVDSPQLHIDAGLATTANCGDPGAVAAVPSRCAMDCSAAAVIDAGLATTANCGDPGAVAAVPSRCAMDCSRAAYDALSTHPGMATYLATQHPPAAPSGQLHSQQAPQQAPRAPPAAAPGADGGDGGGPPRAPLDALPRAKKRRIASQFEDLQEAYLRLRASQLQGPNGGSGGDDGEAPPPPSPLEGRGGGAVVVDDGLQEFSRMLSVLTRCSRLRTVAKIPRPSLRQSSSILSSVEFDRDGAMFATAGVSKRISIFELAAVVGSPRVSVHCPVVELVTRSKLSCLSWNHYLSSHLASSDYEGVVTLWDVNRSEMVQEYEAHSRRIWAVDFCDADPTALASGSDDCSVKVWSTRAPSSTAQLELKANVCTVKWRPGSAHELAVGCADHSVYLYDLRRPQHPAAKFVGHQKAVSYVRFCGERELASSSTDSSLRLWQLDAAAGAKAARVFEGHTNEKNFAGLSVEGGFLACGSETNEAVVYYKDLSKPVARQGFSGEAEAEHGSGCGGDDKTFVSAVCWRPGSQQLLVANSQGTVRVMELTGEE